MLNKSSPGGRPACAALRCLRKALDEVQKMTDAHIAKVDTLAKTKEKEILEIK